MNPSAPVRLEWWANRSTCLAGFSALIEIHERPSGRFVSGAVAAQDLDAPEADKSWELLCGIDPIFRLLFEDGSEFEVQVHPGPEPGLFELTEYTGEPVRKVTLELDLRT